MPKANIERALDKAKGNAKDGAVFTEIIYNATISGGATFLVVTLSDNVNRTTSNIQSYFNKQNAKLGKKLVLYHFSLTIKGLWKLVRA